MEPLSIIAILTFIKDVYEQLSILKDTVDKVSENDKESQRLLAGIFKWLDTLKENCDSLKENAKNEKLRSDIVEYMKTLKLAVIKCNAILPPDRTGNRAALRAWWSRDEIASELASIQTELSNCNQLFITAGYIRIERAVSDESADIAELKETMNRIETNFQRLLSQAASRPEKARSLVRLERMDSREAKDALKSASMALRHNSASSPLQRQYLQLKVQTLQKALDNPSIMMGQHSTSSQLPTSHLKSLSSKSHRPNTGDPKEDTSDAVLHTLDLLRLLSENRATSSLSGLAKRLNALSSALYDIGLFDDSCTMSRQAVQFFRHLVRTGKGGFDSSLAGALNNLSTHLDAAATTRNAPGQALTLLQEAIQIYRDLIAAGQDVFKSDLAVLLINSATRLGQMKRYQDASRAAMDALDIYTTLACDHPHEFKVDQVESLTAVSATLRDIGRHDDSLLAAEKAVEICRTLIANAAGSAPRKFQPELAASLTAYSRSLSVYSKFEKALAAAEEAAKIRRVLAGSRQEVYMRPLALSLLDVFELQQRRGKYREAASKTAKEAAEIFRKLIRDGNVDFKTDLASLLSATADCFLDLDLPKEALGAVTEAIGLYAQLTVVDADLGGAFDIAYTCHKRLRRFSEAYNAAQQAIQIWEGLLHEQFEKFYPRLATSVTNAFSSLWSQDRFSDALKEIQYAVKIYRDLANSHPGDYRSKLASTLNKLSICFTKLKYDDEALRAAKEAVDIFRDLDRGVMSNNNTHYDKEELAAALFNLSCCLNHPKHHQAALQAAEESVQIYGHLCSTSTSSAFRSRLKQSENHLNMLKGSAHFRSRRKGV